MAKNNRILIVDDEPEALEGYREFLTPSSAAGSGRKSSRVQASEESVSQENYEIFSASSGEEALEIFKREHSKGTPIAAGFFDVKMEGGMDGIETIQAIKLIDPQVHCTVVTAYHDRDVEDIHKYFGESFKDHWDYLNKPFTRGEIIQKARQMVSAWNRTREIEEMQAQLIRSERLSAIGQVARGVGHEFGNILLRIMGKLDLALMSTQDEKTKEHLNVAMTASERAGVIVKNLQSFSKPETKMEQTTMEKAVEDSLTLLNHEFVKASVKLEKAYQSKMVLNIDVRAFAQVILNLVINAIHAMPSGGKLKIFVADKPLNEKPGVVCQIEDSGIGIPEDVLPKIFEYAFSTKGEQGSGLGLAISKEIIETHNGQIFVTSKPGKGTTFTIWLPVGG